MIVSNQALAHTIECVYYRYMFVDKQGILRSVLDEMTKRIRDSESRLAEILQRANDAPGAMQSHSDTDKNLYGRQAAGQQETIEALERGRALTERIVLEPNTSAVVGALVVAKDDGGTHRYFLLPGGAGITIESEIGQVVVITPQTPLGAAFFEKGVGETAVVGKRVLTVVDVH